MEKISFATSVKEYSLNDVCTVVFSPTDSFFAEKLFQVFDLLSAKQDERDERMKQAAGKKEIFEVGRAIDTEMREMLNGVFGKDVCTSLFPDRNVYARADGLPEWCNLLLATMDAMDESLTAEEKAVNPRVQQYVKKYQKYQQFKK